MLAQESKKASWEEQSNLSHMHWAVCQLFANMPRPPGYRCSQVCHSDSPALTFRLLLFQLLGNSENPPELVAFSPVPVVCVRPDAGGAAALTRQLAAPIFNEFCLLSREQFSSVEPGPRDESGDSRLKPLPICHS